MQIWLKDAVQCRDCALCCHKKCMSKCQMIVPCTPIDKTNLKNDASELLQPEITMTEVMDEELATEAVQYQAVESKQTVASLKRVNSANNLAIPGSPYVHSQTRSLPPSPQHTPSRKQSLVVTSNPFVMCPVVLEEITQLQPEEINESIVRLLDQVLMCPPDEALMDAAKETGKQLYAHIPHDVKVDRINLMVSELKKALDAVTMEHMDLSKQIAAADSEVEKAKLAFLIGQTDAKVHGLSVLMLHYCSSLQHAQEKIV